MGNYKGINQKGLSFMWTKQKNYKEENKLRKPYEVSPFFLIPVSFYRFVCSKDLKKIL